MGHAVPWRHDFDTRLCDRSVGPPYRVSDGSPVERGRYRRYPARAMRTPKLLARRGLRRRTAEIFQPQTGFWVDRDDAPGAIARVSDPVLRDRLQTMRDVGLVTLTGHVAPEVCDRIVGDFERYCAEHPSEAAEYVLPNGFHSRFYHLHTVSDAALQTVLDPGVLDFLDHLFTARAAVNSTHFFEQGSEQAVHRDTPFFYADPMPGEFVGVWVVLEDVTADSGALTYIPSGHKVQVDLAEVRTAGDVGAMFRRYCELVGELCADQGLRPEQYIPSKGDVAIWHPELPHGGSPITRPGATRRSLVAHYIPEGAYVQPVGYFFGIEAPRKIMEFVPIGRDRKMRWVDRPTFMPND